MEELINRICAKAGISKDTAREAVGIILRFLHKDGPTEKVDQVIDAMPDARALLEGVEGGRRGGLLGDLAAMTGMGALNELTQAGLSMGEVQTVTKEVVAYAKDKVVEDIIDAIPGLSQAV
ncbi:DUF2267 domain-containing protein [Breoghania sp.]|uniref:DUF2267 domain-containing protein n=1 Tax=Breoghania sp. TaxID=2065378 RepID=UPI00262B6457|nr:DUF2267 domain-containing protein [Breoghania sp.]MDJ0931772.1 DUF2267 domain-containing protein [Breoghania sp.]